MARSRGVAQPGSALRSGRRGPQFESGHPDLSLGLALRLALLCGVLGLLAAGCGGSAPLSRTALIQQADAICRTLSTQEHGDTSTDPGTAFDNNLGYLNDALGQLDKLKPSDLEKAKFADMLAHFHSSVAFLSKNRRLLVVLTLHLRQYPQDTATIGKFEKLIKPFDRDAAAAKNDAVKLSLNACVSGLGPAGN